jgi:hypothetical protein
LVVAEAVVSVVSGVLVVVVVVDSIGGTSSVLGRRNIM